MKETYLLNWKLVSAIWIFLIFLWITILFSIRILYRNLQGFIPSSVYNEKKSVKKFLVGFFLFLGYVVLFVIYGEIYGVQSNRITLKNCFIHIGIYYFIVIGWIVRSLRALGMYWIWKKNVKEIPKYSEKIYRFSEFYSFWEYALIVFVSFLITGHYFLLGGTIGLLLAGLISLSFYYWK